VTKRALVTGAAGFVGKWLLRELVGAGWQVVGAGLGVAGAKEGDDTLAEVTWTETDFRQLADVRAVLDTARPDLIVHLVGVAYLPAAAADPGAAYEINVAATGRLLGELRARHAAGTLDPVTLVIGSAEQYGRHEASAMPLDESAEQRPLSVYAASKAAQEVVALEAARSAGLRVVCTRSFNHSGPGQASNFVLPALVDRTLALRHGGGSVLALGNLTPVRDYLHVRDVVRAYLALGEHGEPGEVYNVSSGQGHSVRDVAERVLARAGVTADIQSHHVHVRAVDVPILVGSNTKLRQATGWAPSRSLDDIIDDLIHAATH
jgi:GDP-4-dehydro-6-deoxy-D-mannose reductase